MVSLAICLFAFVHACLQHTANLISVQTHMHGKRLTFDMFPWPINHTPESHPSCQASCRVAEGSSFGSSRCLSLVAVHFLVTQLYYMAVSGMWLLGSCSCPLCLSAAGCLCKS